MLQSLSSLDTLDEDSGLGALPGEFPSLLQKCLYTAHTLIMQCDTIRILITGGTFDKHYDEIQGELTFKNTHLPEILKQIRTTIPVELEINQLIDSLQMEEENRQQVLEACRRAPESRIVITHGTDTMVETAKVLGKAELKKTIVLTGAMVPYQIASSDALFNLGTAFAAAQLKPPGVWIAMNGRIFPWNRVQKNRNGGVFEEV